MAARKLAARPTAGKFDPIMWLLLGLLAVWEVVAVATGNNDAHTISNRIHAFETWAGWPGYAAVAVVLLVVLPLHLLVHAF